MDLQALEDRLAINDLFVRYATALDAGDVETIVGCFAEDGALESPIVGVYKGHDGIREFGSRFAKLRERGTQLRHVLSNLAVKLDGDRAHATCYLVTIMTRDGKSTLRPPGRYECELVKASGKWVFQYRLVLEDAKSPLEV
ncbi:MAG TPA: nuclear transport factor 2 family protein [Acetobacteraceae bacterium]|nr:nuclear transport factor 2 family protein [Acetobacteraceae bacterium]